MKKLTASYVLLVLTLVFVSGCFDIKREIKIYPNGSGTENVYITFSEAFFETLKSYADSDPTGNAKKYFTILSDNSLLEQNIKTDFQKSPGSSIKELTVTMNPDGSKQLYIQYFFDEPQVLLRTLKEVSFPYTNKMNVNWCILKFTDESDKLKFKYVLRKANRSFSDSLGQAYFSSLINSTRISYSIDMPFDVISSNSQTTDGRILGWEFLNSMILNDQAEMTAELVREPDLDLTYAEKPQKEEKVSQNKNPLIRVQIYNANLEPVKIVSGVIVKDDMLVTNFSMMNIVDGAGYFSVRLNNDSLAGVDEMKPGDMDQSIDIIFLRFNNNEKIKTMKWAALNAAPGDKVKIFYHPNTLSPIVYSLDGTILHLKDWEKKNKIIEVKPSKPISISGGAIFNDNGEFVGLITTAYEGEVGKIYAIPAMYIRSRMK